MRLGCSHRYLCRKPLNVKPTAAEHITLACVIRFKDLLQSKYVQRVRGQITKIFKCSNVYSVQNIIHKTVDSSISKIYYIQYNMFNNNEHSTLQMISETLISSVIQLKLDILLMKLQSYKARNSSTE